MMVASTTVASSMRSPTDTLGPNCGAATRVNMNDAPHSADNITS